MDEGLFDFRLIIVNDYKDHTQKLLLSLYNDGDCLTIPTWEDKIKNVLKIYKINSSELFEISAKYGLYSYVFHMINTINLDVQTCRNAVNLAYENNYIGIGQIISHHIEKKMEIRRRNRNERIRSIKSKY